MNKKEIQLWLSKHCITSYTINDDLTVDVHDSVQLSGGLLENTLPFKFGIIKGSFYIQFNKLISLKNGPKFVHGSFYCSYNQLTSLEHCPKVVLGNFYCHHNQLTSLEHCPNEVHGDFSCYNNDLTSLEYCPKEVKGDFKCDIYFEKDPRYLRWLLAKKLLTL